MQPCTYRGWGVMWARCDVLGDLRVSFSQTVMADRARQRQRHHTTTPAAAGARRRAGGRPRAFGGARGQAGDEAPGGRERNDGCGASAGRARLLCVRGEVRGARGGAVAGGTVP